MMKWLTSTTGSSRKAFIPMLNSMVAVSRLNKLIARKITAVTRAAVEWYMLVLLHA
jgi:hypothetical protein